MMGNSVFIFKEFAVKQDACAMKVGTDGVLLGAWARGGSRVLDIGTGTGLIALMMAQRFPKAEIEAIDIAEAACLQAKENVANSVFARRVRVVRAALQQYVGPKSFDCIVSNPPFFVDSLHNPDALRSMARHTSTLSYRELFAGVGCLLVPEGRFSAIIPADCRSRFMAEATLFGFSLSRICGVRTVERRPVKRYLLEFRPGFCPEPEAETVDLMANGERSAWYQGLTADFYL